MEGFEPPPGDPGVLDSVASALNRVNGDLTSGSSTISGGFAAALSTWKGKRSDGFRTAGDTIGQQLNAAAGLVVGASGALGIYATELKGAQDDIEDLKTRAERALHTAHNDTSGPDGGADPTGVKSAQEKVEDLKQQAAEIRRKIKAKAGTAASALDQASGSLVPGGANLSAAEIARRVHAASNVDGARRAMAQGKLTLPKAWEGLGGDPNAPSNPLKTFFDTYGGFEPPASKDDPVSLTLYALGRLGWAGGQMASWMTKKKYGRFAPRGASGRYLSVKGMTFWDRLKAGGGRFPTAKGLTPWERVRGFDKGSAWQPRSGAKLPHSRWATTSKVLSRGGTAVTVATSGWNEWQDSAGFDTDERVGRTVTKAASTTAGAWAGGQAGAWAGGAIGTAICPGVGTVIGAGVGGLIGGFAGSKAGEWVGDKAKDVGGKIVSSLNPFD